MKLSAHRTTRDKKIDLNMTSMIDVVFLLLIFFIVTASFTPTERRLDVAVQSANPSAAQASDFDPAIVDVTTVGDSFGYKLGSRTFTTQDELEEVLIAFPDKSAPAVVRGQDEAPYGMVSAAIQACKNAGFHGVRYQPFTGK
ncbi:biopolymer transporter ExbD [Blastopirellula sp. JC732]|uniref:Biopolymer transporter ExbD n=1 Tax=Blastopirellula sediminis TaxID=2894196 RepID=A0A9X1MRW6_9BACT|nr:biopolymer transporter ExbD [Blastopirellula sediminis]MCC9605395.1 biopolymer transporter ExbD [Blastopirellula sediminis]MCC9631305.1 biopolymer transporter ExbD [Blastopirellula sediminis]